MYIAKIGKIQSILPIEKADTIQVAIIYGTPCIVSKNSKVGDIGVLFIEGGQLAPWFLSRNNLYRDSQKNQDKEKKGYFEDSGRVRAQPFLGQKSEGFFCPLNYLGDAYSYLNEGDEISEFDGKPLCWKYIRPESTKRGEGALHQNKGRRFMKYVPSFHEHVDTKQWRFYKDQIMERIKAGERPSVTITEKLHGTSGRYGYHEVCYSPIGLWFENKISESFRWKPAFRRLLNKVLWWNVKKKFEYVVGSRRVILRNTTTGYYGDEQYRYDILEKIKAGIKPGMTVYGEIVGYHPSGKPFMPPADLTILKDKNILKEFKNKIVPFNYGCEPGEYRFVVYRITQDGKDLTSAELRGYCSAMDWETVPLVAHYNNLHAGFGDIKKYEYILSYTDVNDTIRSSSYPNVLREGVVIRVDWPDGEVQFFKEKTFVFKIVEGIAKEKEEDLEDIS